MSILCYHTVDGCFRSELSLTPEQFEEHCRFLVADRDVVGLATALESMNERGHLPAGMVALTFDDGLEGVYRHVYPTLVRHGLPATVFMVADTLTGAHPVVDWIDGTPAGELRAMTTDQMVEMARDGVTFGSHSSRHLVLPSLTAEDCEQDLRHAREVLEQLLGVPVPHLAYPRGRHDAMVRAAADRAGYTHALALPEGPETAGAMAVPRVGIWAHNSLPLVRLKATRPYLAVRTSWTYTAAWSIVGGIRRALTPGAHG